MDDKSKQEIWGALTAMNMLLTATWEIFLKEAEDPLKEADRVKRFMLAEMDHIRGVTDEARFVASQHAISRLEDFWADMERRLRAQ